MWVDIDVGEVGDSNAVRDARRRVRRARKGARSRRRLDRLQSREATLRKKARPVTRRAQRGEPAERPAPDQGRRPGRRGAAPAEQGWRGNLRDWAEESPEPWPQQGPDEEFEEPFDEEELEEPFDEEPFDETVAGAKGVKLPKVSTPRARLKRGGEVQVGPLRVCAPYGERGLVLPLADRVYLVSHWPSAFVAQHGEQHLGKVMVDAARLRLGGASVGGVGFLPLAVLLVQQGLKAAKASAAKPAAPVTTGADCACRRR